MAKTINEIVRELEAQGHNVVVYQRTDIQGRKRGMAIRRIDQMTFQGSKGNEYARNLVGAKLSEDLQQALNKINYPSRGQSINKKPIAKRRRSPIDAEAQKKIRQAQRYYKKSGSKYGKPTTKNYRYNLMTYGKAEADRRLNEAIRFAKGFAYSENVLAFKQTLTADINSITLRLGKSIPELDEVLAKLETYPSENITKQQLQNAIDALYTLEKMYGAYMNASSDTFEKEVLPAISVFTNQMKQIFK